jgi:uncharacterized protein with von Willebrand factor type A (vWA) domain
LDVSISETYNKIDHNEVDRRWHSSVSDARSITAAFYEIYHNTRILVVKNKERLAVDKQISHRFAGLEHLDAEVEIDSAWEKQI